MAVVNPSCDTSSGWALKKAHGVLQLKNVESTFIKYICKSKFVFQYCFLKTYFLKGHEQCLKNLINTNLLIKNSKPLIYGVNSISSILSYLLNLFRVSRGLQEVPYKMLNGQVLKIGEQFITYYKINLLNFILT